MSSACVACGHCRRSSDKLTVTNLQTDGLGRKTTIDVSLSFILIFFVILSFFPFHADNAGDSLTAQVNSSVRRSSRGESSSSTTLIAFTAMSFLPVLSIVHGEVGVLIDTGEETHMHPEVPADYDLSPFSLPSVTLASPTTTCFSLTAVEQVN